MNLKYLYKNQVINILIALLIGVFLVFPDVVRLFDEHTPSGIPGKEIHNPKMEENPGPREFHIKPPPHKEELPPPMPGRNEKRADSIFFDFVFFLLLSWGLLLLNNPNRERAKTTFTVFSAKARPLVTIVLTFIIAYLGIYLYSLIQHEAKPYFNPFPWYFDGILLFKGLFLFLSIVLFGQIFNLLYKQQHMSIENERLKTESLQNRFEALSAQISPHFFFNSLNSLSGLVREKQHHKALKYINEISHLFRYILKGNWQELVTLKEEMHFLNAYQYLLKIKYGNKLAFKNEVKKEVEDKLMLPALSLQPLVENIIKHNIISEELPMFIRLFVEENNTFIIQNTYQPKKESGESTGIGLNNLSKRFKYLTGKEIRNYIFDGMFIVELPLSEAK